MYGYWTCDHGQRISPLTRQITYIPITQQHSWIILSLPKRPKPCWLTMSCKVYRRRGTSVVTHSGTTLQSLSLFLAFLLIQQIFSAVVIAYSYSLFPDSFPCTAATAASSKEKRYKGVWLSISQVSTITTESNSDIIWSLLWEFTPHMGPL